MIFHLIQKIIEEYIEKSDFTVHLEEFLDSLIKKNIQFELPPKIEKLDTMITMILMNLKIN